MAEDPNLEDSDAIDWLVVSVHKEDPMTNLMLSFAESVHVQGEPSVRFFERIVAAAPELKRVRIIPAYAQMVEPERAVGTFLAEHTIEVVMGRIQERTPREKDMLVGSYLDKRYFMLWLDDERKKLLFNLQKYASDDLIIASRYLCLNGEKHLTLAELSEVLGMSAGHVQEAVGTVLYYLDSPFDVPIAAVRRARVLEEKIQRGHEEQRELAIRQGKLQALDLVESDLPEGLSFDLVERYAVIYKAWKRDRLSEASVTHRERQVLVRRYGLEDKKFRALEEVGQELNRTRERVRQIEDSALKRLRALE